MPRQEGRIILDPTIHLDKLLIQSVHQYGVRAMARHIGVSSSWLARVLRGLGGLSGLKFNAMMTELQTTLENIAAKQDVTIQESGDSKCDTPTQSATNTPSPPSQSGPSSTKPPAESNN